MADKSPSLVDQRGQSADRTSEGLPAGRRDGRLKHLFVKMMSTMHKVTTVAASSKFQQERGRRCDCGTLVRASRGLGSTAGLSANLGCATRARARSFSLVSNAPTRRSTDPCHWLPLDSTPHSTAECVGDPSNNWTPTPLISTSLVIISP